MKQYNLKIYHHSFTCLCMASKYMHACVIVDMETSGQLRPLYLLRQGLTWGLLIQLVWLSNELQVSLSFTFKVLKLQLHTTITGFMWLLRLKLRYSYTSDTLPLSHLLGLLFMHVCQPEVNPWCPSSKVYLVLGHGLLLAWCSPSRLSQVTSEPQASACLCLSPHCWC